MAHGPILKSRQRPGVLKPWEECQSSLSSMETIYLLARMHDFSNVDSVELVTTTLLF